MDADWCVELAADDPALEFPWSSPDGSQYYVDLATTPEAIDQISEAREFPAIRDSLTRLNGNDSLWITAKCGAWLDDEPSESNEICGGTVRMCSYMDIVRRDSSQRFSFELHEEWARSLAARLRILPGDAAVCELIVRRCYFHFANQVSSDSAPGFFISTYVFGYGNDAQRATSRWTEGLTQVSSVLLK